jgi:hypothetical protein
VDNILKNPVHIGTDTVTPEEWIKRFKRWKEKTTMTPSGLHLGHYKALFSPHTFSFEEESKQKQDLDCKQQELLEVSIKLFNKATQNAISLNRWKTVHSIVLHKDKDSYLVNRIRNIHIYEADYNFLLKQKWGDAIAKPEELELLHNAQYGSRKNH